MDSAIIIFHPFRVKKPEEKEGWKALFHIEDLQEEIKTWKEIRKKDNWRDYVYVSPHFHILVVDKVVPASVGEKIYNLTGWICKRVTKPDSKVSISNLKDLCRQLLYCLTHTDPSFPIVRYGRMKEVLYKPHDKEIKKEIKNFLSKAQSETKKRLLKVQHKILNEDEVISNTTARGIERSLKGIKAFPFACKSCGSTNVLRLSTGKIFEKSEKEIEEFLKFTIEELIKYCNPGNTVLWNWNNDKLELKVKGPPLETAG